MACQPEQYVSAAVLQRRFHASRRTPDDTTSCWPRQAIGNRQHWRMVCCRPHNLGMAIEQFEQRALNCLNECPLRNEIVQMSQCQRAKQDRQWQFSTMSYTGLERGVDRNLHTLSLWQNWTRCCYPSRHGHTSIAFSCNRSSMLHNPATNNTACDVFQKHIGPITFLPKCLHFPIKWRMQTKFQLICKIDQHRVLHAAICGFFPISNAVIDLIRPPIGESAIISLTPVAHL